MLGFLDDYEDVLGHMRAADVFLSLSTREGFGITFLEAMAVDCTVIAADHPESAADEVIADAALGGARPPTSAVDHARQYDWDAIAEQAETAYQRAIDGEW